MKKLFFAFLLSFAAAPASAQYYPGQSLKAHAHQSATDGGRINSFTAFTRSSAPIVLATDYVWGPEITISSSPTSCYGGPTFYCVGQTTALLTVIAPNATSTDNAFLVTDPGGSNLLSVKNNGSVFIGKPQYSTSNYTQILGRSHFNTVDSTMTIAGRLEITGTAFINGATISTTAVIDASKLPLAGGTMTGALQVPGITMTGGGDIVGAGDISGTRIIGDGSLLTNLPITSTAAIVTTLNEKLNKAGDTMTGQLTINGSSITATGAVIASRYEIAGTTIIAVLPVGSGGLGVGVGAGRISTGVDNTFVGYHSGYLNTTGLINTCFGSGSCESNVTGNYNTAIGYKAGASATGSENSFFGYGAGQLIVGGVNNVFVGRSAGQAQVGANNNVAVGYLSLNGSGASSQNTAIGYYAGNAVTSGAGNTLIGDRTGANITTGSNNIILGAIINTPAAGTSNHLNIGNLITGTVGSSSVTVHGNLYANSIYIDVNTLTATGGKVGIGKTATHKLDVDGIINSTGTIIAGAPGDGSFACWGTKDGQNRLGYCTTIVGVTCTVCTVP